MSVQKINNSYNNSGYWFLLIIVLVFFGFYKSYFSVIFEPRAPVIHIHFVLMVLWIALLITQPFLIKYKKRSLHRKLGKISYIIVPLALITGFLVMRYSFYFSFNDKLEKSTTSGNVLSSDTISRSVADNMGLPFFYLLWFGAFYALAIINRKKSALHARYMMAASLSLLGPTVDRIIFFVFGLEKFPGGIPIESLAFLIADIILITMLIKDYQAKRSVKTLFICLSIYIIGQVMYFTLPGTTVWQNVIISIM